VNARQRRVCRRAFQRIAAEIERVIGPQPDFNPEAYEWTIRASAELDKMPQTPFVKLLNGLTHGMLDEQRQFYLDSVKQLGGTHYDHRSDELRLNV
jgi:hypothetical protein